MARTSQNGQGTSVARLLGLLAVLLGLLAMHGVAGTHHAAAASPPPTVAQAGVGAADSDSQRHAGHGHAQDVPAADPSADTGTTTSRLAAADVAALPGPACHRECQPDIAMLCLAVLVAASGAALLATAARRGTGSRLAVRLRPAGPPAPRRPPAATPDPVEDLCVSRT